MPVVNGTAGDDALPGTIDHDLINGFQGNDTITADDGDDLVRPGTGDDYADGGSGIDRVSYASVGSDVVTGVTVSLGLQGSWQNTGGGGIDYLIGFEHLTGTRYDDVLTGDGGDNWIWGGSDALGNSGNDTISGGGGNDLIEVGAGTLTLDGGSGIDTLWAYGNQSDIGSAGVTISLTFQGATQDTEQGLWLLSGFENISGSIYDDFLNGDDSDNVLAGDAGNDILIGGAGADTLYGDGQIGVDSHGIGYSGPITMIADLGVNGNDVLEGGAGDDILNGGGGSDTASYSYSMEGVFVGLSNSGNGSAENASGTEFDQLFSIENVAGSGFNDQLLGNDSDNVLMGADGHDLLFGRGGSDTLIGGNGDDFLRGSDGADWLDGGSGWDRVSSFVPAPTSGISFDLNIQGVAQDTGQGWDTLVDIEHASGTVLGDTLTGNGGDNWLWDGADGDATVASSGNDVISAGAGNDLVEVGAGDDTLDGGLGNDTWSLLGGQTEISSAGVTVSLALQGAAQDTEQGMMAASGFENLSGSLHDDELTGDAGANRLDGDQGHDRLVGGDGDDALYGDGRTHVDNHGTGGSGPITSWDDSGVLDPSYAGGNDWLEGGLGNDTLDGGAGIDWASYVNAAGFVNVTIGNVSGSAFGADGTDTLRNIENIVGSAYDDSIFGNSADNWLDGYAGNDLLRGRAGNDTLLGNDGNDFLNGGEGDDVLTGGNGYDRATYYTGATAGVTVNLNLQGAAQDTGSQGMDTLNDIDHVSGTAFNDTLTGDGGDNWIWGSPGTLADGSTSAANNDTLDGGGGNDLLTAGIGNHSLIGGNGSDTVSFTENGSPEPALTISLGLQGVAQATGAGSWTLTGIENLSGGIADDHLTGDGNDNVLAGDQGDDRLFGAAGNDTLYGDGRIAIDYGGGALTSGPIATFADGATADPAFVSGDDILDGGAGDDTLNGGGGSDTASFASWAEGVISGLSSSGNGFATNAGETEFDTLISIENLSGSAFGDQLSGTIHANVLSGGDGNDLLRGNAGNDSLLGGNGNDFLNGGQGDDLIDGGAGIDRATYFTGATAGVTVDLNLQGAAQATGQGMDTLTGIENVSGTTFADMLTGDGGDNWLWGSPATNQADGTISAANNDTLSGGGGNDLLTVGIGNHSLTGGTGSDTVSFTENGAPESGLTVSLALQGVAQATGNGSWTLNGIENLSGGTADDHLTGDDNDNVLAGDIGNDTLIGGLGNDTLYGDGRTGIDYFGGLGTSGPITTWADAVELDPSLTPGNDILLGGRGNDWLHGGRGDDTLTGNQGTDRFVIESNSGDDHITDFAVDVDKVRFDASSGVDDFSDLTLTKVGNSTVVTWGTGDSLTLDGVKPNQLDASDFEFGSSASLASFADFGAWRGHGHGYANGFDIGFDEALAISIAGSSII
ncbi:MAG: hypothetical protein M3Q19_11215 [Pseudomonadota bacterium]|nr:hypothetical protein [Pseudomonadota bacterium]